ncbi:dienelactone hydrolase family protein [Roseateles depolymerans]|uniref:Dienelactone hydrolase-like enzyme n=1 Tax=Roseateles depolymerans TaxID=76731 RepID=A0A0U3L484_9BURK|nr:dienelactone hydrolase family protein [Roseateles depolymerans]ALV06126.1 Dienelactone hydrolase-like enzyme [Roseateles depolymerans]REG11898.1 carboxymethylenebutenolidase [Roseateles depolymerans]
MTTEDFDSLVPQRSFSRRDFVGTAVGSGFAAAVLPVSAQTITTDTQGLDAGPVTVPVGDFKMPAYAARPAGKKNAPVVLVISEIFGVHEHIADVARRFAKQGYLAVAPDLFVRQGDAKSVSDIARLMSEIISKVPDEQVLRDLDATVAWAKAQGGNTGHLGITGFCWGGRITWLYAAHNPSVKAGVAWYGRLQGSSTPLTPKHPIDLVGQLKAPVLGLYGGQDGGIPVSSVAAMQEALQQGSAAAKASEFVVYKDAGHAFHADYRPSYRAEAAKDGWARCLAWFKQHGV